MLYPLRSYLLILLVIAANLWPHSAFGDFPTDDVTSDEPAPGEMASPPPPPSSMPPAPAPVEEPRPFGQGSMNLGLILGLSTGSETSFTFGAGFGYFILAGLEPGLQVEVTVNSQSPTVTALLPYLRWIIWRSYPLSPYLKIQGGRWFISGESDISAFGGGGGLVYFITPQAGIQLEGLVYRLFPSDLCPMDGCISTSFGLSLGFYLGH